MIIIYKAGRRQVTLTIGDKPTVFIEDIDGDSHLEEFEDTSEAIKGFLNVKGHILQCETMDLLREIESKTIGIEVEGSIH